MYAVVIHEGPMMADDNAVYYTRDEPTFTGEVVNDDDGNEIRRLIFVTFKPRNGSHRGSVVRVPFDRVVLIADTPEGER